MSTDIVMPKVGGYDVQNATLVRWLKKEGEQVRADEPVAEIESEKATLELTSPVAGVMLRIAVAEGAEVPVGTLLAIVGQPGEAVAAPAPVRLAEARQDGAWARIAAAPDVSTADADTDDRLKVSPLARRLAAQWQIDLRSLRGSGPDGRITREDIERAHAQQAAASEQAVAQAPSPAAAPAPTAVTAPSGPMANAPADRREPLSKMRRAIDQRMTASATSAPHFTVVSEIDMQAALELRQKLNALQDAAGVSITDMVVRAAALALRAFPRLNASYAGDDLVLHQDINIGVAVMLEDGLVTPVVKHVDRKTLSELASDSRALIERARSGHMLAGDLSGGTFTVSNLGMFDVGHFLPIINPPEAAILAVASVRQVAAVVNGEITPRQRMNVALTVDHRVADGALAARFLQTLKALLEEPLRLLA